MATAANSADQIQKTPFVKELAASGKLGELWLKYLNRLLIRLPKKYRPENPRQGSGIAQSLLARSPGFVSLGTVEDLERAVFLFVLLFPL